MEIIVQETAEQASMLAARLIAKTISDKPDAVLGLPTGSTPLPLYKELIRIHKEENLDFSSVTSFNLDEYLGLGPEHPQSYHHFMYENLFNHINIPAENINIPDGLTENVPSFCNGYEQKIKDKGGIDIQLLGIGSDGHIGFNEPSSSLTSRTRIKTLTPNTIKDNARFFENESAVPRHVITMGLGTVMESRECILLAFGEAKAEAVRQSVEGPLCAMVPASVLQMHNRSRFFIDAEAASKLEKVEYYNWVFSNKPAWQQFEK